MNLPVIARDEAEADIAEAALWYERQRAGLGWEFIGEVDSCFNLMARQPEVFPVVYRSARLGLLHKFPYLVVYRVFPQFMHGRRHPRRWKARVPSLGVTPTTRRKTSAKRGRVTSGGEGVLATKSERA